MATQWWGQLGFWEFLLASFSGLLQAAIGGFSSFLVSSILIEVHLVYKHLMLLSLRRELLAHDSGFSIVVITSSLIICLVTGNGKVGYVNQANNMYLFPGIGLGPLLLGARFITDGMLQATVEWWKQPTNWN